MKTRICLLLFITCLNLVAQEVEKFPIPQNVLSFETGIANRGFFGLGYNRNIPTLHDNLFYSLHASGGVGMGGNLEYNYFATLAPSLNLGGKNVYITAGVELKYIYLQYSSSGDIDPFGANRHYEGPAAGAFIGFNIFSKGGFNLKLRGSWFQSLNTTEFSKWNYSSGIQHYENNLDRFGVGMSLGFRIGQKTF